ncbi:unnamed protein product [Lymnaea stagnalis]|uniref:G-protein coupled receptors family 1 profile domain-containing protein n=1 Tax=Lymnaea stagnalis TaxID=6523 RepID=A0AAV2HVM8_LYMST
MMTGAMGVLTQDILVTSILMGLIGLVGLIGNCLMLRALIRYHKLRTEFYIVFGGLSIADCLFLVISVPAHIIDMLEATEVNSLFWCRGSTYVSNACSFITAYLLVALAILRSILLTNRNITSQPRSVHLLVVTLVTYGLALIASIPIMQIYTFNDGFCQVDSTRDIISDAWLVHSFAAFIPILLVAFTYIMTYLMGKRYFSDSYSRREKEKSRLVTSIVIVFTVCQLPYRIFSIYENYLLESFVDEDEMIRMYTIKNYLMCLIMADKAFRPVLYSKLASDLSETFDEVINCTYCSKSYNIVPIGDNYHVCNTETVSTITEQQDCELRESERTASTSSSSSATSQTPLVHKSKDPIVVDVEIS